MECAEHGPEGVSAVQQSEFGDSARAERLYLFTRHAGVDVCGGVIVEVTNKVQLLPSP